MTKTKLPDGQHWAGEKVQTGLKSRPETGLVTP